MADRLLLQTLTGCEDVERDGVYCEWRRRRRLMTSSLVLQSIREADVLEYNSQLLAS